MVVSFSWRALKHSRNAPYELRERADLHGGMDARDSASAISGLLWHPSLTLVIGKVDIRDPA